ncbi:heat shock protein HspQ [Shewanella violacea]|uniref:Heat shock protein HspQ n=1 Tax=Shewanella violacea (strain JCM 10179 / CIP 106290 / LMG 19151 / DSS12) TaxID=637905 RepID=D4ZC60_SHEVD|nr:heat shock protein HspQ [Shewanella violacea]BAJ03605.1 conserved hypothetical protein [Shewanella violacea DSS12]
MIKGAKLAQVAKAKYSIGELIHHRLFGYRGVILDVDADFQLSPEWYEMVARSRPAKDKPWYHVLVDQASHSTYVAEQNLEADLSGEKINNPMMNDYFTELRGGHYITDRKAN